MLLRLPPHRTHRLQPLDVPFSGPLESYHNPEITTWLKSKPGRTQVATIFGRAYGSAASLGNITSDVKKMEFIRATRMFFRIICFCTAMLLNFLHRLQHSPQ
ncbi:hypothetical protein HUJ05_008602 [Dendroctonus ponderosae]|nr:hypothetical protein HUJ05_008602 [Dendroctonus ponderosae]